VIRALNRKAGIALVLTLWVITILMVTATYFAYGRKWDSRVASYYKESTFSYYLARSAIAKTRILLSNEGEIPEYEEFELIGGFLEIPREELGGGYIGGTVTDLEARVNLNKAPFQLMRSLLINTGCEYEEAETIAGCILDWRDADSERRANGAEDDDYLGLPNPYPCKDAPFDTVEEVLLVQGMTEQIFYGDSTLAYMKDEPYDGNAVYLGLKNYLTVFGRGKVNVNTAELVTLEAIPGVDEDLARYIISKREKQPEGFKNISEVTALLEQSGEGRENTRSIRSNLSVYSYYFLIEATGSIGVTETRIQTVIYRYGKNSRILPRIVSWKELS
jgi:general secretion pathway protein K